MKCRQEQRSRCGSSFVYDQAITLAPILSYKSRHFREFPFSTTSTSEKEEHFESPSPESRNIYNEKSLKKDKKSNAKNSKQSVQSIIFGGSSEKRKELLQNKQMPRLSAKSSLGHFVKRSNGSLPCRYGFSRKKDILLSNFSHHTENCDVKKEKVKELREIQENKQFSESKIERRKCFSRLETLNKGEFYTINTINKISSDSKIKNEAFPENELKSKISLEKKVREEVEKVSICLARSNHKILKEKVCTKEQNENKKVPYFLLQTEKLNISLSTPTNGDEVESLGLGESVIEKEELSTDNNFAEETDRLLLQEIEVPLPKKENRKHWRKLPFDFLKAH